MFEPKGHAQVKLGPQHSDKSIQMSKCVSLLSAIIWNRCERYAITIFMKVPQKIAKTQRVLWNNTYIFKYHTDFKWCIFSNEDAVPSPQYQKLSRKEKLSTFQYVHIPGQTYDNKRWTITKRILNKSRWKSFIEQPGSALERAEEYIDLRKIQSRAAATPQ